MTSSSPSAISSPFRARWLAYDHTAPVARFDGLTAFAPVWAIAAIFSLAADPNALTASRDLPSFILSWVSLLASVVLLVRPRLTFVLAVLAVSMLAVYAYKLPVASNNKTISAVMNASIVLVLGVAWVRESRRFVDRENVYLQLRVIARALLAIMYFYGIYHKINTDFLDPNVSCAVGLYQPLARPFGLAENIWGKYISIYATFVIETITIVGLYWRRLFAVGLLIALVFHFIIPISAYSWYMDFSSLVFALYMLSMPRPVSEEIYAKAVERLRPLRRRLGHGGVLVLGGVVVLTAAAVVAGISALLPTREPFLLWYSAWIVVWAVVGGLLMVLIAEAAIEHLPYRGPHAPAQPLWLYALPVAFFISCLSPYVGLKTESSINMFSNLHTEGGYSNHLVTPKPPYIFDYQERVVRILDSSHPALRKVSEQGDGMVRFALGEQLRHRPNIWVTYEENGRVYERVTNATFTDHAPNILERKLLVFKRVDFDRPKVCTH